MPTELIKELRRRRLDRYASGTDAEAVSLAHEDLLSSRDYRHSSPAASKMHATDVLRSVAVLTPALITDTIVRDCQKVFPACNDSSRINIIRILSLLRRKDALRFLEQVRDDNTRPNASIVVWDNGRYVMKSVRDDSQPDWVTEEAIKSIAIIQNDGPSA